MSRLRAIALPALLAGALGPAGAQSAPPPVVLVPGLNETTGAVGPASPDCAPAGELAAICAALRAHGLVVYVVPSAGGRAALLDNAGAVAPNAARLAGYLRALPAPALVVGRSMGGLVARQAVVGLGAPAAGLFTIGAPHTGSFGADLIVAGAGAPCRRADAVCVALRRELCSELAARGGPRAARPHGRRPPAGERPSGAPRPTPAAHLAARGHLVLRPRPEWLRLPQRPGGGAGERAGHRRGGPARSPADQRAPVPPDREPADAAARHPEPARGAARARRDRGRGHGAGGRHGAGSPRRPAGAGAPRAPAAGGRLGPAGRRRAAARRPGHDHLW